MSAGLSFVVAGQAVAVSLNTQRQRAFSAPIATAELITDSVSEASRRFGVPQAWIRAVMRIESGGVTRAVSSAGAVGLMQVMPQTYAELRSRYRLGPDPFDVRDNVLAGAAYIRELADRYGAPAFLAAYNAGPARFDDAANGVRSLPWETLNYLARLGPIVNANTATWAQRTGSIVVRSPLEAPLFVTMAGHSTTAEARADGVVQHDMSRQKVATEVADIGATKHSQEFAADQLAPTSKAFNPLFPRRLGPTQ